MITELTIVTVVRPEELGLLEIRMNIGIQTGELPVRGIVTSHGAVNTLFLWRNQPVISVSSL